MLSHSISSLFFVLSKVLCFACFSLFNLQGTSVRCQRDALRSDVLHFNTTSLTCQALFRFLLTRFRPRPPSKAASRACYSVVFRCLATALIYYHRIPNLSTLFLRIFCSFFHRVRTLRPLKISCEKHGAFWRILLKRELTI